MLDPRHIYSLVSGVSSKVVNKIIDRAQEKIGDKRGLNSGKEDLK